MGIVISNEERVLLTARPETRFGHVATVEGDATWQSGDPAVVEILLADPVEGELTKAYAVSTGVGATQVTATVQGVIGTLDVEVVAAGLDHVVILAGNPEPLPE